MANPRGYTEYTETPASMTTAITTLAQEIGADVQGIVAGTTPIGTPAAAIANATGTLADLTTKFNTLLGVLRTKGVISP